MFNEIFPTTIIPDYLVSKTIYFSMFKICRLFKLNCSSVQIPILIQKLNSSKQKLQNIEIIDFNVSKKEPKNILQIKTNDQNIMQKSILVFIFWNIKNSKTNLIFLKVIHTYKSRFKKTNQNQEKIMHFNQ